MINEAPKLSIRPILVFSYVILLHVIILVIFFMQIADPENKLAQTIIQKFTSQNIPRPSQPNPLVSQPPKLTTKISKAKLDKILAEQTGQHALKAANKVKTINDEQLYFISHVVDMSDEPKQPNEQTKSPSDQQPTLKKELATKTPTQTQAPTGSQKKTVAMSEEKPETSQVSQQLTQPDITKTSAAIKKILELAGSYLPEIKPNTNKNSTTEIQPTGPTVPKTLATPTIVKINPTKAPTGSTVDPTTLGSLEPTETVRQYSDRELAQLQKDLEAKTELLAQQAQLNSQKYTITKTELKNVKFNLDVNNRTDQKLNYPDSQRLDRVTIELPEVTEPNELTLDPANPNNNNNNNSSSSSSSSSSPKFQANTPETNINIGDHSNGPGSKPIIRALAPSAYLRFANANGQHIMSQAGLKSGQPSIQDLRKLSYNAMVMRTFGDAFNAFKLIFNMFINEHTTIFVRFVIDPTGKVVHIDTHSDNATPDVLEFIRKAITYANPFPPLPKHLAKDNYIFGPFAITFHSGRVAGQYVWTQSSSAR